MIKISHSNQIYYSLSDKNFVKIIDLANMRSTWMIGWMLLPIITVIGKNTSISTSSNPDTQPSPTPSSMPLFTTSNVTICGSDYFQCWDTTCLPREKFCDGFNDCPDGSDEVEFISLENVVTVPCMPLWQTGPPRFCLLWNNNWVCDGQSHCIEDRDEVCANQCPGLPETYVCNGYPNCPDGSDELNCTAFSCGSDTNITVYEGQLCDGIMTCPDGRDECMSSCNDCFCDGIYDICANGEICQVADIFCRFCADKSSIFPYDKICDGEIDCPDASDELFCNQTFVCDSGEVIYRISICDGIRDCSDGSDEAICSVCPNNNKLIPRFQFCDGINDCGDHSDECGGHCQSTCKFICGSGECISSACFCDGIIDCADGSDEIIGNFPGEVHIMCNNTRNHYGGSCLLQQDSWLCDLVDHCEGRVDECQQDCHKASFWCDTGKCIRVESFCDNVQDCEDGTDEVPYAGQSGQFPCKNVFHNDRECSLSLQHPWTCDGLQQCTNRSDECLPYCESSFICGSGECIKRDWVCDGDIDCGDGSDEHTTDSEAFTCAKTRHPITRTCLLPISITQDNISDCDRDMDILSRVMPVESDAKGTGGFMSNVETLAGNSYFRCKGEKRIIPVEKQCDGNFDCLLLSDECLCEKTPTICGLLCYGTYWPLRGDKDPCLSCDVGEVRCEETCIQRHQICDGKRDCSDGIDEQSCTPDVQCAKEESEHCKPNFTCHSVDKDKNQNHTALKCDGRPECTHYEDECDSCPEPLPAFCQRVNGPAIFNMKLYSCNTGGVMLPASEVCDGLSMDCPDGADEKDCPHRIYCNSSAWLEHGKEFGGAIHISKSQICDGKIDCRNQMDESDCPDHFYCETGNPLFVPIRAKTDGKADCIDGSDECPSTSFSDDVFASREHMIRDAALRYLIWVMGGLSIIGNLAVLGETLYDLLLSKDRFKNKRPFAKVNHVLVINLATADLLMGVYLILLGSMAASTSGSYCLEDKSWRSSHTCALLGSITIISCVTSVLMLVILTSYRLYGVLRPFKCQHVSYVTALMFAFLAWCTAFMIALLPIANPLSSRFISHAWVRHNPYFVSDLVDRRTLEEFIRRVNLFYVHDVTALANDSKPLSVTTGGITWSEIQSTMTSTFGAESIRGVFGYYSAHSVCMPKLYVTSDDVGWVQSMVIIIFNFAAFIYIVASYVFIFYKTNATKTRRSRQNSMLRRISYLVATDLACWIPICVMSFMNLAGAPVPENAYAISAVILLPINSALNPLLYSNVIQRIAFKIVTCGKGKLTSEVTRPHETRDNRSSDKASTASREPSLRRKKAQSEKLHVAMSTLNNEKTGETVLSSVKTPGIDDQEVTSPML